MSAANVNEVNEINGGKQFAAKKTWIKKRGLSEFTVRIQSSGGEVTGGEVSCVWTDKTEKFSDINEVLAFIEEQCDAVWYPQSQRKLRGWD